MANALTVQKKQGMTSYLSSPAVKAQINDAVGVKNAQRFITSVVSSFNANPVLADCTYASVFGAALLGETLHLSPSPQLGQFYMVPFNNTKTIIDENGNQKKVTVREAQFQLGYKGLTQMALRTGLYRKLNVMAIKQGELIAYDPLNEEIDVKLIEDETEREDAPTIGYYAMFELTNGFRKTLYWSKQKMERHALRYSKGYSAKKGYTFWEKDFDAMAYKTMLRQLISKWGIMSTDEIQLMSAIQNDQAVITAEPGFGFEADYVENNAEPEIIDAEPEAKTQQKKGSAASALFGGKA